MKDTTSSIPPERVEQVILLIRGQRVMLDRDLAALYGVETKNLNKAVRRNLDRFPADFMFQLTPDEAQACAASRFQFGTLKRGQHFKYLPRVFTQEGVAMLSSVLRRLDRGPAAVRTWNSSAVKLHQWGKESHPTRHAQAKTTVCPLYGA